MRACPGLRHQFDILCQRRGLGCFGNGRQAQAGGDRTLVSAAVAEQIVIQRLYDHQRTAAGRIIHRAPLHQVVGERAFGIAFSNAKQPLANNLVQRRAMDYAAGQNSLVIIQPLDPDLLGNGCAHEGAVATRLGLPAIPEAAETAALAKDIELVAQTGARTHFGQLSCARSVDMVRRAKAKGLPISADCAIHQLFLTDHDIGMFNSNMFTIPPLRSQYDRDALREGLADGSIDCLCSDHQPHEIDAKLKPYPSAEPGISGLDTLLALAVRLADEGVLPLPEMIARVTLNPAMIMGLPGGRIGVGEAADLIVVDPDTHWICRAENLVSKGRNTAFEGWDFRGSVTHTIVGGNVVHQA